MTAEWNSDRLRHGAERRATVRLMYYWLGLRRVGTLPAFADFDPRRNPVRWDICFLIHAAPGQAAAFEHIGDDVHAPACRTGEAALSPDRVAPDSLLGLALEGLETVWRSRLPYRRDGSHARDDELAVRYRSILLPFADLNGDPRYVLGAVSHCIDAADLARLVAIERAGPIPLPPAAARRPL